MTQKELHNQIVLNASPEAKTQFALACALHGVPVQEVEKTVANLITGIASVIRQEDLDYLNKIIL